MISGSIKKKIMLLSLLLPIGAAVFVFLSLNNSSPSALPPVKPICLEASDKYSCIYEQVSIGYENFNLAYALSVLRAEVESGGEESRLICHPVAHKFGSDIGSQKDSLNEMLDLVTIAGENARLCDFGFVHGSLEGYADSNGADLMIEIADDMCSEVSSNVLETDLCFHGLGHSIFIGYKYDYQNAVKGCESFEPVLTGTCVSGVIMEWAIHPSENRESSFLVDDPALKYWPRLCESFQGESRNGCLSQVWHALRLYPQSDERRDSRFAIKYCEDTYNGDDLNYCIDGVGRLYWADGYPSPKQASEMCAVASDDEIYLTCLVGYASSRGVQYLQAEKTIEVCDESKVELKAECLKRARIVAKGQDMVSDPIRDRKG